MIISLSDRWVVVQRLYQRSPDRPAHRHQLVDHQGCKTHLVLSRRRERQLKRQLVRSWDVASAQLTFSSLSLLDPSDPLILYIDISLMKLNFISRLNSALLSKLGHLWGNDILQCILSTLIPGNKSHLNSYFLRKNTENQYTIDAQNSCFDELNL